MKKPLLKFYISCAAFLLSILLGISVLLTPLPKQADEKEFSAYRAAAHIAAIAIAPRTVDDREQLKRVKEYLKGRLEELGCAVRLKSYDMVDEEGVAREITNIYAEMPGQNPDALLLVAHYDSHPGKGVGEAPGSHGASDDAYGLSVILECLRAVKSQGPLDNTLRVLFTDGEEAGMLGAKAAVDDEEMDVTAANAVFNVESRGLRGPAILFETSGNNRGIVEFYAERARHPAAWSIASDVYAVMPNYTDFSAFIGKGMQGLNFSNLDSLDENHTPRDRYENIDLSAIQGYGEQLLPVIRGFAAEDLPASFRSDGNMTFFTLLNGLLVRYPSEYNYPLLAASFLAVLAYIIVCIRRKAVKKTRLLFAFAVIGLALAAAAAGVIAALLLSLVFGAPFIPTNMPGVPFGGGIAIIAVALLAVGLFFLMRGFLKRGWAYEEIVSGVLIAFLAMQAAFTLFLPGGAFYFGWACLAGAAFSVAAVFIPGIFKPFTGFAALWIATPVVILLHVALTAGALGVVLLFAAFPLMLFLPVLAESTLDMQRKTLAHR